MKTHIQKQIDRMDREPWYMIGASLTLALSLAIGLWIYS